MSEEAIRSVCGPKLLVSELKVEVFLQALRCQIANNKLF